MSQPPPPAAAAPAGSLPPVLEESIKKTIDLLSRIIKKPPLNTKLLSKPPFRYLHDMFSEIIRVSDEIAFARGLYDETEMNAENVKEKDAKVVYLFKMINMIGFVTNVDIKANPLKIVAGMDPEDTNSLLQLIAKVVLKKADTSNAVKRVLAGEHFKKAATSAPQQQQGASQPAQAPPERRQPPASAKPREAPKMEQKDTKTRSSDNVHDLDAERAMKEKEREKEKDRDRERDREREREKDRERGGESRERDRERDKDKDRERDRDDDRPPLEHSHSSSDVEDSDKKGASLVPTAAVKRRERPTTARAPPPKVKGSEFAAVEEAPIAPSIIQEGVKNANEDSDDEGYIVIGNEEGREKDSERDSRSSRGSEGEVHGGLVRKILDTKDKRRKEDEEERPERGEAAEKPKEKSAAKREIEALRESIQTLCRSTNPLAKTMDYMQEDVDSMNKELEMWRKETKKYTMDLEEVSRESYEALMPLDLKLKQIEANIEDMVDKISNQKAAIIQNEIALHRLLKMITHPVK
ncbi:microtubule-binding protein MIP-T3-domain-containing protein [Chytriomyces sp. MP71]|nr:microtubule-binding protein MIP-T3-domain-containing protein [Chytriomyces sp. MP71]